MKSLQDQVVVITGAGSGIGRALALESAHRGAQVAISDAHPDRLEQTAVLLEVAGVTEAHSAVLDVSDREAFASYAATVAEHFGRVNVVVNNAGVSLSGPITSTEYDDVEWLMNINFWGVVHGTKEFLPHLIASGDGHLVNISSLFGLVAMPGQATYNAAKFAVRGFTESVRQDMLVAREKVGVTCVHPGGIKTNIVRSGRVNPGEDGAALAEVFDTSLARTTPQKAAEVILDGMLAGKPRVLIGLDAHLVHHIAKLLGARYQGLFAALSRRVLS